MVGATFWGNALTVVGAISTLAFAVGVVFTAVRSESRMHEIPWWWWLGNGASLLLIAAVLEDDIPQGTFAVGGAFSLGIGVATMVAATREGRLRFRRRPESVFDQLAAQDWHAGANLMLVGSVTARFALDGDYPYIDFTISLLNQSLHSARLMPEVTGRIRVRDTAGDLQELHQPPEPRQFEQGNTTRPAGPGAEPIILKRREGGRLSLRQQLLPAVQELLMASAGQFVPISFEALRVNVQYFDFGEDGEEISREPEPIRLRTESLLIPDGRGTS